jgi:cation transport ATPase
LRTWPLLSAILITCVLTPFLAGYTAHLFELSWLDQWQLAKMYAEDGRTVAETRNAWVNSFALGTSIVLTPIIVALILLVPLIINQSEPKFAIAVLVAFLAIVAGLGAYMISHRTWASVTWGTPVLMTPIVLAISMIATRKLSRA